MKSLQPSTYPRSQASGNSVALWEAVTIESSGAKIWIPVVGNDAVNTWAMPVSLGGWPHQRIPYINDRDLTKGKKFKVRIRLGMPAEKGWSFERRLLSRAIGAVDDTDKANRQDLVGFAVQRGFFGFYDRSATPSRVTVVPLYRKPSRGLRVAKF